MKKNMDIYLYKIINNDISMRFDNLIKNVTNKLINLI